MSIYYRTNEFREELCPTCGKKLFHTVICTYPAIPRYECTNCGYTVGVTKLLIPEIRLGFQFLVLLMFVLGLKLP